MIAMIGTTSPFMTSKRMSVASSSPGGSIVVPTMPFQIIGTLIFSVADKDAVCCTPVARYYDEVVKAETSGIESRQGVREQHLFRQIDLAEARSYDEACIHAARSLQHGSSFVLDKDRAE